GMQTARSSTSRPTNGRSTSTGPPRPTRRSGRPWGLRRWDRRTNCLETPEAAHPRGRRVRHLLSPSGTVFHFLACHCVFLAFVGTLFESVGPSHGKGNARTQP